MIMPRILNAGCYTHAQKSSQIMNCYAVGLYVKGAIRTVSYYPDGSLRKSFDCRKEKSVPALKLSVPGSRMVFEYGEDRENWVIMLAFPAITFSPEDHTFYWNSKGHFLPLPDTIYLTEPQVMELRHLFTNLCQLYTSSLPKNQLEAELLLLQILHYFLRTPGWVEDRVERFRKRIAEDSLWERSITEHCADLGVNRDQLRKEFFQRYKIAPGEYRIQLRLQKIRHLLAYSEKTLKEIAFESGMKNLSHLSSFVRERCGKTPSELREEYNRSGKGKGAG